VNVGLKEWWTGRSSYNKVVKAYKLAATMQADFKAAEKRLKRLQSKQQRVDHLFRATSKEIVEEMDRMEDMKQRWEEAMELLRQDNEIMHELLVPNLEAHYRLAYERLAAMTALEVGRRVSLSREEE